MDNQSTTHTRIVEQNSTNRIFHTHLLRQDTMVLYNSRTFNGHQTILTFQLFSYVTDLAEQHTLIKLQNEISVQNVIKQRKIPFMYFTRLA